MTDIQIGLIVSVVGLSITFLALLVFIGVIVALQKLFPPKLEKVDVVDDLSLPVVSISASSDDNADESLVAALAVAAFIRSRRSGQLGASLLAGPGPYWTSR
ncbi:MAG: hypothetical protein WCG34_06975 [Leptolinea sp.]